MDACARALVQEHGCSVTIVYFKAASEAPFLDGAFFDYPCQAIAIDPSVSILPDAALREDADLWLICSWNIQPYKRFAAAYSGQGLRVLCMDNQWLGTVRQRIATLVSPFYLRPYFDFVFLPGDRQAEFARRLGFRPEEIFDGHLSCDFKLFSATYPIKRQNPVSHRFLFVGRLVESKGIAVLLEAWERFVSRGRKDWRLRIVGEGSFVRAKALPDTVEMVGFVQPSAMPKQMLESDVFVLPSFFEPWGLVIHEASANGLPIICTKACGAADVFVRHGQNGFLVETGSVSQLLSALEKVAALDDATIREMSEKSHAYASRRTSSSWADVVMSMLERRPVAK